MAADGELLGKALRGIDLKTSRPLLIQRHCDDDARTVGISFVNMDVASHLHNGVTAEGESYAQSLGKIIWLIEHVEDMPPVFLGDTSASIGDAETDRTFIRLRAFEGDAALLRELVGIEQ